MVFPGVTFTDSRFHQTGKRWEHVDRRVDALVVQLPINENLAFCDVTCKVGDGVGNVWRCVSKLAREAGSSDLTVVRHCEDGDRSNGAITALDTSGTLVNCG